MIKTTAASNTTNTTVAASKTVETGEGTTWVEVVVDTDVRVTVERVVDNNVEVTVVLMTSGLRGQNAKSTVGYG
jgi:hypothetical protein